MNSTYIFKPVYYEDILNPSIVTCLRNGHTVILNTRNIDEETKGKIVDFMCGAAYAIDGQMAKLSEHIFLFSKHMIYDGLNSNDLES